MRNTSSLLHNTSIQNNPYYNSVVIDINQTNIGEYVQENKKYPSNSFIILISLISAIIIINHGWYYGILLLIISISPGILIISQFKDCIINDEISVKTITDLFTFGAIISVSTTLLLEGLFFNYIFYLKNDNYSYYINQFGCNLGFSLFIFIILIKYIISIGIIEEACKLIGLLTIKPFIEDINYKESFTSHYLKSNFGYVIAGISCSLGFAIIENIVYLSNSMETIAIMILVGIARGVISIPFHIFASGYTTILFSRQIFIQDDFYPNTNYYYYPIYILKQIIIKFLTLLPAGILHGIYDSSLILLVLIHQDYNNDEILGHHLNTRILQLFLTLFPLKINKLFARFKNQNLVEENSFNNCFGTFFDHLITIGFLVFAILSYFICFFLFIYNWIYLEKQNSNRRIITTRTLSRDNISNSINDTNNSEIREIELTREL
ncbi:Protease prsW family protein [Cryptosporidium meleagridis]|uniref:Protease prsW family protein n=1 Tax=Cryptosporidium meleagridis TaxID=93969 RepID=A0A2P4YZA0_9CRYT|nr:Protease prsW family protein [Cryptosporidium meleagridis]